MAMVGTSFYLIEPRPTLRDHLQGRIDPDFIEILLEERLVSNQEHIADPWSAERRIMTVKLIFLASLSDWRDLATPSDFASVFGSPEISVASFDRWWTIRRMELEGDTKDLLFYLKQAGSRVTRTGDKIVDQWIDRVQDDPSHVH